MTVGYECWKKGIRVPSRGATTRSGVRYQYFNMRERGERSGNGVGGGGVGRVRRRDRDTWRVRERGHGIRWSRRGRGTTWRRLAWDLCNLNFSAFRCSKLLDGGRQGLRIGRM